MKDTSIKNIKNNWRVKFALNVILKNISTTFTKNIENAKTLTSNEV